MAFKTWLDNLVYRIFEAPRGLDFARNAYPYKSGSDNVWYERTYTEHVKKIFSYIKDKRRPFLDLGCGKGYLLYRLQKLGFTHTDGLEYNLEFAATALQNMERLGLEDKITIYNMDARDFVDFDRYEIIYMFHPFRAPVMREVVRHVEESLDRRPRPFTVVYFYPIEHRFWDISPYFSLAKIRVIHFANTEMEVCYYEHEPGKVRPRLPRFSDVLHHELEQTD